MIGAVIGREVALWRVRAKLAFVEKDYCGVISFSPLAGERLGFDAKLGDTTLCSTSSITSMRTGNSWIPARSWCPMVAVPSIRL